MSLSNTLNRYKVYGLVIDSEIEVKEFTFYDGSEDIKDNVKLFYGKVSEDIKELIKNGKKTSFSKEEIWFHIDNIATYYITNGNSIMVEPCENTDIQLMKVYLMCSCLGFIMLQRDMVAIHGGTIVMNNKAIILTGDKGAGKSTLTTALRLKGYPFISDDVAATSMNERPVIKPGFPYQKLCKDAMDNMGYDKEKCESFMSDTEIKFMVPAHNHFVNYDVPLAGMCELNVGEVDNVQIEEITGNEKLNKLIKNIYRTEYIRHLGGMKPKYFKQCIEIAKNIKFYKITRPVGQFTVDEQIKLIEDRFLA